MNKKKHIVIINANAHKRKIKHLLLEMEETFKKQNMCYEFHTTHEENHAEAIYSKQKLPCRFYIVGGDGTLHQAANALHSTQHEIVLLPAGTGNDFSRMLKDHKHSVLHFRKSLQREAISIDVLKVNDTICINAACFALDHDIADHVHDTSWQIIPRKIAYLTTVLRRIFLYRCDYLTIYVDGKQRFSGKALFATCNNAKYYGGGFCMTPNADLRDGKMDICVIKAFAKWKILVKCFAIFAKQPNRLPECVSFQCQNALIHASLGANLDGETYLEKVVQISVLPNALRIVNELK